MKGRGCVNTANMIIQDMPQDRCHSAGLRELGSQTHLCTVPEHGEHGKAACRHMVTHDSATRRTVLPFDAVDSLRSVPP